MQTKIKRLESIAKEIRRKIISMSHDSKVGHLGSALSVVDIVVVLYYEVLKIYPRRPHHPQRDRFILSKGHAASALYAVLANKGFFPKAWLTKYCQNGGKLGTHPDHVNIPGVEWTTGSLGHGLSVGCGMALCAKLERKPWRTFVVISDAESQEGEVWEAALAAVQHKLGNLCVVIDYNKVQAFGKVKDILNLEPFAKKWSSFGWQVFKIDGHDIKFLLKTLKKLKSPKSKPTVIIANTTRSKGVPFMENKIEWYYNYPRDEDFKRALKILK